MFVCDIKMLTYFHPRRYSVDFTDDVDMINYERFNKSVRVGGGRELSDCDRGVIESCLRL